MQQKTSNLISRAKIMSNIRQWFAKNRFIEVETPILVDCPDLSPNFNVLETIVSPSTAGCPKSVIPSPALREGIPLMSEKHILAKEIPARTPQAGRPPLPLPAFAGLGVGRDDKTNFLDSLSVERAGRCRSTSASIKYLITSPEFSMKKLLSLEGMDNIYTITKVFRDGEEYTGIHSIEFTMLEWYRKNADYKNIIRDTEELVKYLLFTPFFKGGRFALANRGDFSTAQPNQLNQILGRASLTPNMNSTSRSDASKDKSNLHLPTSEKSPLTPLFQRGEQKSFPRIKISNLFKKYANIDNVEKLTLPVFKKIVHTREYSKDKNLNYEQCFNLIFLNEIEPNLPKTPFFLIDYPAPLAALAKLKKGNRYIAERFELYINGIELCNGFSELTDGKEQLARFKQENRERKLMGKEELPIDYELCEKLDLIGKAGGNALGIDRLVMLLLGARRIEDVLY